LRLSGVREKAEIGGKSREMGYQEAFKIRNSKFKIWAVGGRHD
jgi:hypothetical protein